MVFSKPDSMAWTTIGAGNEHVEAPGGDGDAIISDSNGWVADIDVRRAVDVDPVGVGTVPRGTKTDVVNRNVMRKL